MKTPLLTNAENGDAVQRHITSKRPIRPENGPDEWEREALKQLEDGT